MGPHEEFLELCAAATAGELSGVEQAKLEAHLAVCPDCRRAMSEYEAARRTVVTALAQELAPTEEATGDSWSVEEGEKALFKRLDREQKHAQTATPEQGHTDELKSGRRFTYRPSQIHWREVWMPFAAAVLLALALGIAAYRTGVTRGTDVARTTAEPAKGSLTSLEEQVSDAGHERTQLLAKLAEEDRMIADLRRQLPEQQKAISALKAADSTVGHSASAPTSTAAGERRDQELATAQANLLELQKTIGTLTEERDEVTSRAATLEAKVGDLTQLVRDRERELDQKQEEVAKQQNLLEHDRDIRELMGARDLYIAEVHDVFGTGQTDKTYGRVFYTKGKRLIFYAYDLDAQPGVRNASSFQAWGRRGPNKQQALSLGILYEDNAAKKRWVLKANDPKTLEDIDAVFVTIEPNGGSQHPSGKQLLFAYLRVNPNHP
jgi:hypothetical protein